MPSLGQVPYEGPRSVAALARGRGFAGNHVREGVVVRPLRERWDPVVGRVILKYLCDDYLLGNHEDTTDQ